MCTATCMASGGAIAVQGAVSFVRPLRALTDSGAAWTTRPHACHAFGPSWTKCIWHRANAHACALKCSSPMHAPMQARAASRAHPHRPLLAGIWCCSATPLTGGTRALPLGGSAACRYPHCSTHACATARVHVQSPAQVAHGTSYQAQPTFKFHTSLLVVAAASVGTRVLHHALHLAVAQVAAEELRGALPGVIQGSLHRACKEAKVRDRSDEHVREYSAPECQAGHTASSKILPVVG